MATANGAFTEAQTHGIARLNQSNLHVSSERLNWESVYVSKQTEWPYRGDFPAMPDPLVAVVLDGPAHVVRSLEGRRIGKSLSPGTLSITPGGSAMSLNLTNRAETLHVYLRQNLIEEAVESVSDEDPGKVDLIPRLGVPDNVTAAFCLDLLDLVLNDQASSQLYVDHLARALASRLVRKHSNLAVHLPPTPSHSLDGPCLRRIEDFIQANMHRSIRLEDLAGERGFSPAHFIRLFKKETGLTPYQFVTRCRIDHARFLLAETRLELSAVSAATGFSSQAHFSKVFREITGESPGRFRRDRRPAP